MKDNIKIKDKGKNDAFTLIEILVVVALIAMLSTITFIAVNPTRTFENTRNAQRSNDALQILNAVTQYISYPNQDLDTLAVAAGVTGGIFESCSSGYNIIGSSDANLSSVLAPEYIVGIPIDPSTGTMANTGYTICIAPSSRITISSLGAEGTSVSVSR